VSKVLKRQLSKNVIRIVLYCFIPMLVYFSTTAASSWMTVRIVFINNMVFISLIVFVILTLNLTRRQKGFKVNPLDFLIFIVIIVFPNLPSVHLANPQIKLVVAKVLILFFSYDVLLGELRQEDTFLDNCLLVTFFVIALNAFI
jgi:UDP-GlcNAc:undecaprenyl-phosphate GlcNAc-1-phosphate transferase